MLWRKVNIIEVEPGLPVSIIDVQIPVCLSLAWFNIIQISTCVFFLQLYIR